MFKEGAILEKVPDFNPKINLGTLLTNDINVFLSKNTRFKYMREADNDCVYVFGLNTQTTSPIALLVARFRLWFERN